MNTQPFYVERECNGKVQWLKVADWHYAAWSGCFCLITDRAEWLV